MDKLGDLFDQPRLVDLIGNFRNNDRVARAVAAADLVDDGAGAHLDNAAALAICTMDLFAPIDKSGGWKIRSGN